mmetsp:Transcript_10709/g.28470  ORF Transcript_10709/g.28470 Transcript_10709/m.28470 type:complete len:260 (+) Transcript_10709:51-830(+)
MSLLFFLPSSARLRLGSRCSPVAVVMALLLRILVVAEVSEGAPDVPVPVSFELRPLTEEYPAFARGEPPVFSFSAPMSGGSAAALWKVIKNQSALLNSMPACSEILNFTGPPGEALLVVQWHTPNRWHRWLRTDVRKYVTLDDATMSLSYVLVGGFGSWLPRLAFREQLAADEAVPSGVSLKVDVWYELDDTSIGWPTDNLQNLTRDRWTMFYNGTMGYAETVQKLAEGALAPRTDGKGALQSTWDVWLKLKFMGGYEL